MIINLIHQAVTENKMSLVPVAMSLAKGCIKLIPHIWDISKLNITEPHCWTVLPDGMVIYTSDRLIYVEDNKINIQPPIKHPVRFMHYYDKLYILTFDAGMITIWEQKDEFVKVVAFTPFSCENYLHCSGIKNYIYVISDNNMYITDLEQHTLFHIHIPDIGECYIQEEIKDKIIIFMHNNIMKAKINLARHNIEIYAEITESFYLNYNLNTVNTGDYIIYSGYVQLPGCLNISKYVPNHFKNQLLNSDYLYDPHNNIVIIMNDKYMVKLTMNHSTIDSELNMKVDSYTMAGLNKKVFIDMYCSNNPDFDYILRDWVNYYSDKLTTEEIALINKYHCFKPIEQNIWGKSNHHYQICDDFIISLSELK
jgi:hypothetical protein